MKTSVATARETDAIGYSHKATVVPVLQRNTRPSIRGPVDALVRAQREISADGVNAQFLHALTTPLEVPRGLPYRVLLHAAIRGKGPRYNDKQVYKDLHRDYRSITTEADTLEALTNSGVLVNKRIPVRGTVPGEHRWDTDGFEYVELPKDFDRVLLELGDPKRFVYSPLFSVDAAGNLSNRNRLREKLVPFLTDWGRKHGLGRYTVAIPVDAVSRDTGGGTPFGAVGLAHIDFTEEADPKLLKELSSLLRLTKSEVESLPTINPYWEIMWTFKTEWKPKVELALQRKLEDKEYLFLRIKGMNNIWTPTCKFVTRDNLAFMTTKSLGENDTAIYQAGRRDRSPFKAQLIEHQPQHEWVIRFGMKLLESAIFKSAGKPGRNGTPHTSASTAQDTGKGRTSVECRFLSVDVGEEGLAELTSRWDAWRRNDHRSKQIIGAQRGKIAKLTQKVMEQAGIITTLENENHKLRAKLAQLMQL